MAPLLELRSLSVDYGDGPVIDRLSLSVSSGEVVGLVGESGCGKTTLGWSILGLLPDYARVTGSIMFEGRELTAMNRRDRRKLLGSRISLIPQSAMASLDPMRTIGHQFREMIAIHRKVPSREIDDLMTKRLHEVGIGAVASRLQAYPHELSGGTRQRIAIAEAMALAPSLVIADEPTSSLDVTIQAQVLTVLQALIRQHDITIIFITHDLGVVAQLCGRVAVMYAGEVVEDGPVEALFEDPKHPYTKKLLSAHPARSHRGKRLDTIAGSVPDPSNRPVGCSFAPRCPVVLEVCHTEEPPWVALAGDRHVRCVHYET